MNHPAGPSPASAQVGGRGAQADRLRTANDKMSSTHRPVSCLVIRMRRSVLADTYASFFPIISFKEIVLNAKRKVTADNLQEKALRSDRHDFRYLLYLSISAQNDPYGVWTCSRFLLVKLCSKL